MQKAGSRETFLRACNTLRIRECVDTGKHQTESSLPRHFVVSLPLPTFGVVVLPGFIFVTFICVCIYTCCIARVAQHLVHYSVDD
jgi:hypothetical protein